MHCVRTEGRTDRDKIFAKLIKMLTNYESLQNFYDSREISNKVYEGLNFQIQHFLYTNFMAQKIVCDPSSISVLLKTS